jgi:hypothetical protein
MTTGSSIHSRFNIPLQAPISGLPRTREVYQQGNNPGALRKTGVSRQGATRVE